MDALPRLVGSLAPDLPAAVLIVLHISAESPGVLPQIISRNSPLPVAHPSNGEKFRRGHVYVAPPDHLLLIDGPRMRVLRGPKENRHRPAIDPLFRDAASSFGPPVVGVVLTGNLDDGTAGLNSVKIHGGVSVV